MSYNRRNKVSTEKTNIKTPANMFYIEVLVITTNTAIIMLLLTVFFYSLR